MAIRESMTGVTYDELFGGPEIPVLTKNVTLAKGAAHKRGEFLTLDTTTGTYALTEKGKVASAVLAYDTDATSADTIATVYTCGRFNREKLIVADGDTVDAHEEELRGVGIYLASLK